MTRNRPLLALIAVAGSLTLALLWLLGGPPVAHAAERIVGNQQAKMATFSIGVPDGPVLQISPTSFAFTAPAGGANPPAQSLAIANAGSSSLLSKPWPP